MTAIAGFLRNNHFRGEPVATAVSARDSNRVANVLMDISGDGCKIYKPTDRGGRGWKIVVDPFPASDVGADTADPGTLIFHVFDTAAGTNGAPGYITWADLLALMTGSAGTMSDIGAAVEQYISHTALDFSSPGANTGDKEANTDHDYRYPILGNTYTDVFFQSIAAASATKTTATPKLRIDLTNAGYYDDQATPKLAWDAGARTFYDADGTTKVADFDAFQLVNGTNLFADWSDPSNPELHGYDLYVYQSIHCEITGANTSAAYYHSGNKVVGAQGATVADATGGVVVDAEARTAINALLARIRAHGLIAT